MNIKIYFWSIRIFSILFFFFISLFALDTITYFWGFLIHLVPSIIVLLLIIISWKHQITGGLLFIVTGLFSFLFFNFEAVYISLSPIFIGILFLLEIYFKNNEKRRKKIS
ncbi:hypothetical protein SDC9_193518 [bioreactor metagenome]|uniref:DUF7670 domain-containing protein n=1 Tax=bioreactor metagenome TaxID=1076179 RepID=A0A645I6C3_9ZZZZ